MFFKATRVPAIAVVSFLHSPEVYCRAFAAAVTIITSERDRRRLTLLKLSAQHSITAILVNGAKTYVLTA